MSRTTNANPDNQPVNDRCIMCMSSFGITDARIPCKCINVKCGQQSCNQCVQTIQAYNGNDRPFRCMHCLKEYRQNQVPEKNELLVKQLWSEAIIKYGIKRTRQLLLTECKSKEFIFDIDCRRRHLLNLISLWGRFLGETLLDKLIIDAYNMTSQFSEIIRYLKEPKNINMDLCKDAYRKTISTSSDDDDDLGLFYIRLCEDLQLAISIAEYSSLFPKTNEKMKEWMHQQGSADEFQPKTLDLLKAIEQDLINQWSKPYLAARTKIGVIGYTSAGKSSLANRLLGVISLAEEGAAPVSIDKSTYFPLQFDRKEPLTHPEHPTKKTLVTFVDIQGYDKNRISVNNEMEAGSYLDEIYKADCDIYVLVYDEELSEEQQIWINYVEHTLERKCILVRSKVDNYYLANFQELSGIFYSMSDQEQKSQFDSIIIQQLQLDSFVESRSVYLVACDYSSKNIDADLLLKNHPFDFPKLVDELGRLAFDTCACRIHALAHRSVARVINTCFRRGYVLNILKYKIAAGFAAVIPFADQLPRYLSRDSIKKAFGIDDALRQYLTQFHLIIINYKLQTSVFKECVEIGVVQTNSGVDVKIVGKVAGTALVVGSTFTDDIIRVAAPTATAVSGAARVAFYAATIGIGVVLSAAICAWSAVDSGNHIFSYVNRVCDDLIMVTNPLIKSIIAREQKEMFSKQ